jgi:hypothetical protein
MFVPTLPMKHHSPERPQAPKDDIVRTEKTAGISNEMREYIRLHMKAFLRQRRRKMAV